MPSQKQVSYEKGVFFITFVCCKWINLIKEANGYHVIYEWFAFLCKRGHSIVGFVIMPNHVHALIAFKKSDRSINTQIGEGKRFMAYKLVKLLLINNCLDTLHALTTEVKESDRRKGKLHQVWEPSFDWKLCYNKSIILQKLNYIHQNPCRKGWDLCGSPELYEHSSAKFYFSNAHAGISITHYNEIEEYV